MKWLDYKELVSHENQKKTSKVNSIKANCIFTLYSTLSICGDYKTREESLHISERHILEVYNLLGNKN